MEVLATAIRQEKEIKGIQIGKEEANLSVFADDMLAYVENGSMKKQLDLINEFGKRAGFKAHIQKLKAFLYINNEISESEIRKKIPLALATRKIKYLGLNFTKEVKDLYSENYITLKKKLRKTQTNGSIYCVHGWEELTSLKCPYYPKQFVDSYQDTNDVFHRIRPNI